MLTNQQKNDVIKYMIGYSNSIKPIIEDVDSIGEILTDDNYDQVESEICSFLDEWKAVSLKWVKNEHT